jgi:hypothetical protein
VVQFETVPLPKTGWSRGCVSAINSEGGTIWIADAHRDDGKRLVVRADDKLNAFQELERITSHDSHRNQVVQKRLEVL